MRTSLLPGTGGAAFVIAFWNRAELLTTTSMWQQAEARAALAAAGIDYSCKTSGLMSQGGRGHAGSFGINMDCAYTYAIYVRKKDLERAQYAVWRKGR